MATPQYRRVSNTEDPTNVVTAPNRASYAAGIGGRLPQERVVDKLVALFWVLLALVVAWLTSFFTIVWSSDKPNRFLLRLSGLFFTIDVAGVIYLFLYLPTFLGLKDSSAWPIYCPRVVPGMTVSAIMCFFLLIRAMWPVWGFFTPMLVGIESMGGLFALSFIPWRS